MNSRTVTHGYGVSSFLSDYYCSRLYHKHRICKWFGAAIFWVSYFFRTSILFLVLFSQNFWKALICLLCKLPIPFLTFVNYEGRYFAEGFLHNLCQCFDIVEWKKKGIKEATVPNIPSRKISLRNNFNEKQKKKFL